ncbi:hypothetical protein AHAS_Ahas20G0087000 [Arachis hypogaea]
MRKRGLKSNKITFTTLINEHCKDRDMKFASNQCSKYNDLLKFRDTCPTSWFIMNLYLYV